MQFMNELKNRSDCHRFDMVLSVVKTKVGSEQLNNGNHYQSIS